MKAAIRRRPSLHNFHVPLPADVYRRLRREAESSGEPATEIAREAIREALRQRQRRALHVAIGQYARRLSGTGADLDRDLEAIAVDFLVQEGAE
jgi:hypothetical protein